MLGTIKTAMALLPAALSSKGWCNHFFHSTISKALVPNPSLRVQLCSMSICTYVYVYIQMKIQKLRLCRQVTQRGLQNHCFYSLKSVWILNSAISMEMLSRQGLLPVPCIPSAFVRPHTSKEMLIS